MIVHRAPELKSRRPGTAAAAPRLLIRQLEAELAAAADPVDRRCVARRGALDGLAVLVARPDRGAVDGGDDRLLAAEALVGGGRAVNGVVDDEPLAVGVEVEAEVADRIAGLQRLGVLL